MVEAAKMKRWMPDQKGRSRRKGYPTVPGGHSAVFFVCTLLPLVLMLPGCAAKSMYWGHPATDLSSLSAGTPRSRVDALLGLPDKQDESNGIRHAWHLYDRGFVGTLEGTSAGEKILWAPIMAWGELVSLGLVELMILCQTPCQKGLLEVKYDQEGHLLQATEHIPPDAHPAVKECMTRPVRNDLAVCQGVRERRRPSTLPESGNSP
ncbi:MAG: hypothetical protein WBM97_11840 [Sedimenticolaceae bacterium]